MINLNSYDKTRTCMTHIDRLNILDVQSYSKLMEDFTFDEASNSYVPNSNFKKPLVEIVKNRLF